MANLVKHDKKVIEQYFSKLGKKGGPRGGKARAASLTPERRLEIARKASAAAAEARRKK